MTRLTLAARNLVVQAPEVKALIAAKQIGSSKTWSDGWVFDDKPYITIEKYSHQALLVITDANGWQEPNDHNTARFPKINVDIWASPTRNADKSVVTHDADRLIEDVFDAIYPYLHTIQPSVPGNASLDPTRSYLGRPGFPRFWGTAEEIEARTGVLVISSKLLGEPSFFDVEDGNGARMGRYTFGLQTA